MGLALNGVQLQRRQPRALPRAERSARVVRRFGYDTIFRGGGGAHGCDVVAIGEGRNHIEGFTANTDKVLAGGASFGLEAGAAATLLVNGLPTSGARTLSASARAGAAIRHRAQAA
jgi:hypothetical protein